MSRRLHEIGEDGDPQVDQEAKKDRVLGPEPAGQSTEGKRERDPEELDEDERQDHRPAIDPERVAVAGSHPLDGSDPVVVNQEGHEHQAPLAVASQVAKCLFQSENRIGERTERGAVCLTGFHDRRLSHLPEKRDREEPPPDRDGKEREPRGERRLRLVQPRPRGKPKPRRLLDPEQIEDQEQAAADIAERVTGRRDPVDLVVARDVGQHRIVEDEAAVGPDIRQHEQDGGKDPLTPMDEKHHPDRGKTHHQEPEEQPLLDRPRIGQCPEQR